VTGQIARREWSADISGFQRISVGYEVSVNQRAILPIFAKDVSVKFTTMHCEIGSFWFPIDLQFQQEEHSQKSYGYIIRIRAFIIGSILIPVNCYWIVQSEVVRGEGYLTELSLFANVVFSLFVLTVFSLLLKYAFPKAGLNRSELLIIYVMLATGTALVGHDMMQPLVPIMGHAFWFATPENEWETLFWKYIPRWLTVGKFYVRTRFCHALYQRDFQEAVDRARKTQLSHYSVAACNDGFKLIFPFPFGFSISFGK